jgi:hypothetical protein
VEYFNFNVKIMFRRILFSLLCLHVVLSDHIYQICSGHGCCSSSFSKRMLCEFPNQFSSEVGYDNDKAKWYYQEYNKGHNSTFRLTLVGDLYHQKNPKSGLGSGRFFEPRGRDLRCFLLRTVLWLFSQKRGPPKGLKSFYGHNV